jgi:hypothetical protein
VVKRVAIVPWKLIEAAEDFAKHNGGKGRPRPIWLRRAVSTAYYALYHCLARAVAEHVLPNGSGEDQLRMTRLFRHNGFKGTCAQIAGRKGGKSNEHLDPLSARLRASPLLYVASTFYDLQEARHKADYDYLESFSKQETIALIGDAKTALDTLESVMPSEREAFLALLAMSVRS